MRCRRSALVLAVAAPALAAFTVLAVPVGAATASASASPGPVADFVVTVAVGADLDEVGGAAIGPRDAVVEATASEASWLADRAGVVAVERDEPAVAATLPAEPCLIGTGCPVAHDQRALRRIGAETAWDVTTGSTDVVVALVDAGVDPTHPDLAGRVIAVPPGPGAGGCTALDPALGTADRTASGHGTRIAGIIAAAADGQGIAGVAYGGVQVRSYAALGPDLRGTTASVVAAINCAVDDGVDVINLSLTAGDTTAMRNALDRAAFAGIVVVAAAGNGGNGQHPGPYPAAHPSVVAVTAVVDGIGEERRAAFANGGAWVDLAAPGTGIPSTVPGGGWSVADGTSYAVPFVSGAAALVLAREPGLDALQVKARLESTAEALADPTTGRGLVDLSSAVRSAPASAPPCATGAGWVLDAFGALHAFGGAPEVGAGVWWPGWDIARDVVTVQGLAGGYVLDGHGALHPFGGAQPVVSPAYRPDWDIARGADRRPDGSVVVVDGQGGLHVAGGGPGIGSGGPWWPGEDIARDVAVDPSDPSVAYVLDAFGGVHVAGAGSPAPRTTASRYTLGRDLARRLVVLPEGGRGYVLDAAGRLHPWAVAGVALPVAIAPATALSRAGGVAVDRSGRLAVVSGEGAVVPAGGQPCRPSAPWSGRDLARGIAFAP